VLFPNSDEFGGEMMRTPTVLIEELVSAGAVCSVAKKNIQFYERDEASK